MHFESIHYQEAASHRYQEVLLQSGAQIAFLQLELNKTKISDSKRRDFLNHFIGHDFKHRH